LDVEVEEVEEAARQSHQPSCPLLAVEVEVEVEVVRHF
jgi:hypothetical protein